MLGELASFLTEVRLNFPHRRISRRCAGYRRDAGMVPRWVILSAAHTAHPNAVRLAAAAPGNWTSPGGSEISSSCEIRTRSTDGSNALPSPPGCLDQAEVSSEVQVRGSQRPSHHRRRWPVAATRRSIVMHFAYVSLPNESDENCQSGEGYVFFQQAVSC